MPQGYVGDQHFTAAKLSPDLAISQSLAVQLKGLLTHAFQVCNLFFESRGTILPNVSASREDDIDVQ
jgi:hypothetical protein